MKSQRHWRKGWGCESARAATLSSRPFCAAAQPSTGQDEESAEPSSQDGAEESADIGEMGALSRREQRGATEWGLESAAGK